MDWSKMRVIARVSFEIIGSEEMSEAEERSAQHISVLEDPPQLRRLRWFVSGTDGFAVIDEAVEWALSQTPNVMIRTFGPVFWFVGDRPDWRDDGMDGPLRPWPPSDEQRRQIDETYERVSHGELSAHQSRAPTFSTLEEAVYGSISRRFVHIVAKVVTGDQATVWTPTNEAPDFEPYEERCYRNAEGRWSVGSGQGGFSDATPEWVLDSARRLGWN